MPFSIWQFDNGQKRTVTSEQYETLKRGLKEEEHALLIWLLRLGFKKKIIYPVLRLEYSRINYDRVHCPLFLLLEFYRDYSQTHFGTGIPFYIFRLDGVFGGIWASHLRVVLGIPSRKRNGVALFFYADLIDTGPSDSF